VKTEAELGVMKPQVKEGQQPPEAWEKQGTDSPPRTSGGSTAPLTP